MKLTFFLERIVDWTLVFIIGTSLSFYLSISCAFLVPLIFLAALFLFVKKTPGMVLFKRRFEKKPSFSQLCKILFFVGSKETVEEEKSFFRTWIAVGAAVLVLVGGFWESNLKEFSSGFENHQKNIGWEYYISQERGFTVQLPQNPSVETKQLYVEQADKTLNYNEYKSQVNQNTYYTVSFMDFPSRWRFVGSTKLLNTAFDILVKSEKSVELVSKNPTRHKIYPAIEFTIKNGNEEWKGRLILVGNTFYKVMRVSPSNTSDDSEFDDFLRSFQFPAKN